MHYNVNCIRLLSKCRHAASTSTKISFNSKKILLCTWWDWKEIIYYKLLHENITINSLKYCQQLNELKREISQNHPESAKRRGFFSTRTMLYGICLRLPDANFYNLVCISRSIHRTLLTLYPMTIIYLD